MIKYLLLMMTISVFGWGCYYDDKETLYPAIPCDTTNVTYSLSVSGIIKNNCIVCHNQSTQSGNVNLSGFANVVSHATDGSLLGTIENGPGHSPMPKGGNKLSDCDIGTIKAWMNAGMPDN